MTTYLAGIIHTLCHVFIFLEKNQNMRAGENNFASLYGLDENLNADEEEEIYEGSFAYSGEICYQYLIGGCKLAEVFRIFNDFKGLFHGLNKVFPWFWV